MPGDAIVLAVMAAAAPASLHFGALRGTPIRPRLAKQKSVFERLIFRHIWILISINGALAGLMVFLWEAGLTGPVTFVAVLAIPTLVAQLVCLSLAKMHDATDTPRQKVR